MTSGAQSEAATAYANVWPSSVIEVVAGAVYAIGGRLAPGTDLPWISPNTRGFVPFQCYALRSAGGFALIDGGLPVHRRELQAGLKALTADIRPRIMMITRRDVDAIVNIPWLLRDLEIENVYLGGGDVSPLDFFESVEKTAAESHMHAIADRTPSQWLAPGTHMSFAGFDVEYMRTSLRVLSTNWIYESSTRTLFTSDSFAFLTCEKAGDALIVHPEPGDVSVERIMEFIGVKFDWLRAIDTRQVAADVEAVFAERPIERICPAFGRVIEGRENVKRIADNTIEALRRMAELPRISLIEGFDWSCCEPG